MGHSPKHGNATLLTTPDSVTSPGFTPGSQQLGDIVTDEAGGAAVIGRNTPGGAPTVIPLQTQAQFALQSLILAGTLTPAGANPAAAPAATLAITGTRNGQPAGGSLVDVVFTFAATEAPTFAAPTEGLLFGGATNGLVESGIARVQLSGAGTFSSVISLPVGAPRTVTPVAFRLVGFVLPANTLDFSATVFGGP